MGSISFKSEENREWTQKASSGIPTVESTKRSLLRSSNCGEPTEGAARAHTPVSEGKIGFGSQGPEVLQLKKDLKATGFYDGVLNDKMGNDGIAALEKAKTQLGIGGPKDLAGPETLKAIADTAK